MEIPFKDGKRYTCSSSTVLMLNSFWTKECLIVDTESVSETPNRQDFIFFSYEKLNAL